MTNPSPDEGLLERLKGILATELRRPEMSGEPFSLTTMAENVAVALSAPQPEPTEMVERVARAIAIADGKDPDAPAWVRFPGNEPFGVCWRDQYSDKARAAIATLRPVAGNGAELVKALTRFKNTVPVTKREDGCPWCLSHDHWAGRLELCSSPSSRAIIVALAAHTSGGSGE